MGVISRAIKRWNAFRSFEEDYDFRSFNDNSAGPVTSYRPHSPTIRFSNEKSIISSIYTRIGIDVAGVPIHHVKVDDLDRYSGKVDSRLETCLTLEANLDQAPRAFRQDIVTTLFDKGVAAIVPVDTDVVPTAGGMFQIFSLRVGEVVQWYPRHVRVNLYNENKGIREEITLEKRFVAIVENPMYSVMNEPNSTLSRLQRKLNLLDSVDEATSSGKLDLIIQLPYVVKSEARKQQAEQRRKDIEFQLKGSQYGIAYTDGTEKITQLNRPTENNLLKQIEYLTGQLYGQLGLTVEIMNGTADEAAMVNYRNRTVEPILDSVIEAMTRAWLGLVGINRKERIKYYQNPFKLMPLASIAEVADKFTRNEILSSNEIRAFMGIPPSDDPKADMLINSNMPNPGLVPPGQPITPPGPTVDDLDKIMNDILGGIEKDLDGITGGASG